MLDLRLCATGQGNWRELLWSPGLRGLRQLDIRGAREGEYGEAFEGAFSEELRARFGDAVLLDGRATSELPGWEGLRW